MRPAFVEMSARAAAELRARGGQLYVWDADGRTHCRTAPPDGSFVFDSTAGDGWTVHVQREITPPAVWVIKWKRFPRGRFAALYDGSEPWSFTLFDVIEGILGR